MTENAQRSPVIDYIHTVVGGTKKPDVSTALNTFEDSLRSTFATATPQEQRIVWSSPVLGSPVFQRVTKPFPEFNGDSPLVALARTIKRETGIRLPEEVIIYRRQDTGQLPDEGELVDVFVLLTENASQATDLGKLPRVDRMVKDGRLHSSSTMIGTLLRQNGIKIEGSKLRDLLTDLPGVLVQSRNGRPVMLYPDDEAEERVRQYKTEQRKPKLDPAVWAPTKYYAEVYDIALGTVAQILRGVGKTHAGFSNYYRRDQANEAFREHYSKKRTGEGIYFREGEPRVPIDYLHRRTGISHPKLKSEIGLMGKADDETGLTLYPLADALTRIDQMQGIPQVDKSGIFTDEDGKRHANANVIKDLFGISADKLGEYLEGAETIPVRGRRGKPHWHSISAAYDIDEIAERAASFLARPKTIQTEVEGETTLITAEELAGEYGLSVPNVQIFLRPMRTPARGRKRILYDEKQARARLDAVMKLPEIDTETNQYVAEDGTVYVVKGVARDRLGTSYQTINKGVEEGHVQQIKGRKQLRALPLYSLFDIEAYKNRPHDQRSRRPRHKQEERDRRPEIELEARELLAKGISFTSTSLRKAHSGFAARVSKYYPGGIAGLREALGIADTFKKKPKKEKKPTSKKRVEWASLSEDKRNDLLEQKARALITSGVRLSPKILVENEASFLRAAARYYTRGSGGLAGLREVLGIADTVKKQRNWKTEKDPIRVIRREIRALMEEKGGDFTGDDLTARGLWAPVEKYYPGGYARLRVDMGLKLNRVPKGYWTPEKIRKEATAIIRTHGTFSTPLAEEIGALRLLTGIKDHYPGGITQLLTDLGQTPNRREWDENSIESEALNLYKENGGRISNTILTQVSGLRMAVYRYYPGGLDRLKERLGNLAKYLSIS